MRISQSVKRAFDLLLVFRESRQPMTATEIGRRLPIPQSTLSDMLSEMRKLRYLDYDAKTRRYFPSFELYWQFEWLRGPLLRPPEALKKVVDEIAAEVGETASLMRRENIFCSLLYVRQSARPQSIALRSNLIGAPLCQSIAGRTLLSTLTDSNIRRVIVQTRIWAGQSISGMTIDEGAVFRSIEKIRAVGILDEESPRSGGINVIAALVHSRQAKNIPFVLTIVGAASRISSRRQDIIASLRSRAGKSY